MSRAVTLLPDGPRTPSALQLWQYSRFPLTFLEACSRRYGNTFTTRMAGYGKLVMLAEPNAVKDVFRGDGKSLHSGEGNAFLSDSVGTTSVLVLDGEPHARQRRVLLPPLKGDRMRAFQQAMRDATLSTIRSWPVGQPIRMVEPMQEITLHVILQAVLGLVPGPELDDFANLVRRVLAPTRHRYSLIYFKILPLSLLSKIPGMPFYKQLRELDVAIYALLKARRQGQLSTRGENILSDLLDASHEDGRPLSDQEVRDAVVTLVLAGHDTTALALAWALEQIVPREDVVTRITGELSAANVGDSTKREQPHQLPFLDAVIRETLRLRTILPFVVRVTKSAFTAGGREYPPGVLLCPCNHLIHRRSDLYPDPERFNPNRFLERHYAAHEWFPFGGGNRMCLGMAFALFEMKVVLSTLFAHVSLLRPYGSQSQPIRRGISLAPDDGARMTVLRHL